MFLAGLSELDVQIAQELVQIPASSLSLRSLKNMTLEVARELIKFGGDQRVFDPALARSMSTEAYKAIAGFQGRVDWRPSQPVKSR